VFKTANHAADIACFSNVVANSTAGWVSNALSLKGVNVTLSPGPHAGLQSLAYAYDILAEGRAPAMLAAAADEVYAQSYFNYDLIGYLYEGEDERDYRVRLEHDKRKVIGEGAAVLVMETLDAARGRGAAVWAEVLGYGMSMDAGPFLEQNLSTEGLLCALNLCRDRSGVSVDEIDLVAWAPQGNRQDRKVLDALDTFLAGRAVPLAATSLNTGYVESASILMSLGATLQALTLGGGLWPQRTGIERLDRRVLPERPRHILACAGTDLGYNFAVLLRCGDAA
jgi:3-oxoacyl-(acyl-carrier-protein) synthase